MAEKKTAYELQREARIAANKQKIAELGIHDSVAAVQQLTEKPKPAPRPKRKAAEKPEEAAEIRRSQRPRNEVNYAVDILPKAERGPRDPIDYTEKIKSLQLDSEAAEKLRAELEAKRAGEGEKRPRKMEKKRGPIDSGKGVRVQGGRVYDSKFGVTCHWCRQKTLEAHVTCTTPSCAKGKMPYSFCHKCLKNRHGEDADAAAESGRWICPACRGSCGPGCVICCNCGPCRKKASLEPTAQIVFLARSAGFSNVHDYLVHLVTGEKEEDIAARKEKHAWGAWLRGDDASDASVQTGAGAAVEVEEEEEEEEPPKKQANGRKGARGKRGKAEEGKEKAGKAKAGEEGEAAVAKGKKAATSGKGGKRGKKGGSGSEEAAAKEEAGGSGSRGDNAGAGEGSGSPKDVEASGGDQDKKLSRKARMMQRMGLAPREEVLAA